MRKRRCTVITCVSWSVIVRVLLIVEGTGVKYAVITESGEEASGDMGAT